MNREHPDLFREIWSAGRESKSRRQVAVFTERGRRRRGGGGWCSFCSIRARTLAQNGYEIHKSLFCELTVHPSQQNQVSPLLNISTPAAVESHELDLIHRHSCTCFGRAEERRRPSVSSVHSQRSGNTHLEQINTDCTLQKHSDQLLH